MCIVKTSPNFKAGAERVIKFFLDKKPINWNENFVIELLDYASNQLIFDRNHDRYTTNCALFDHAS